jgi:flagellar protein FliO/FliZ
MKPSQLATAACAAAVGMLVRVTDAFADAGERTPLNLGKVKTDQAAQVGGGGGTLVRTFVGLAVVIGVIYGLHWVLKQVKSSKEERASGSGLHTLATLPLGPGRSLHLVRAGGEIVLLGVGDHGVTPIRSYPEEDARAAGLLDPPDDDVDPITGRGAGSGAGGWIANFIDELRRRSVRK